jgi:hypothetical protein
VGLDFILMAVNLAFRLAVVLALKGEPAAQFVLRYVQTHDPTKPFQLSEKTKRRLSDPEETDEALTQAVQAELGYGATVATFTGDFETRRVQLEFTVTGPAVVDEDVRVVTFHHVKLTGGVPSSDWLAADFNALVTAYQDWWQLLKVWYSSGLIYDAIKIYKAGPNIVPPQPPVFSYDTVALPGTGGPNSHPPQVALSVTERAGQKKNWGRFYLPSPATASSTSISSSTAAGRPSTQFMTLVADATDALYETCLGVNLPHVVYRPLLEEGRPHEGNTVLPERPANAQTVDTLQVDDVYDVMRSRRWENPTLRLQRGIGAGQASTKPATPAEASAQSPEADQDPVTSADDESQSAVQSP